MENSYAPLIKKIKKKKTVITVLAILSALLTLLLCSPMKIIVLNEVILDRPGNFTAMSWILILILCLTFVTLAVVLNPMTASMITECDPEKHLFLNAALNKSKNLEEIYAMDHFYLGNFAIALSFANKMVQSPKQRIVCVGLFHKARCEFFLKDISALKATTEQYRLTMSHLKLNKKMQQAFLQMQAVLDLLVAIGENDRQTVAHRIDIAPWNTCKPTQGLIHYVRGLAATVLQDKEEAIYRFKSAKEICEKTVLSSLADENLANLRDASI